MSEERDMYEEGGDSADAIGDPRDTADTGRMERLLEGARPLPSPSFRGALARMIAATQLPRAVRHWRPKALALAIAGTLLLTLAGAGVAGEGPLAPSHATATQPSTTSR